MTIERPMFPPRAASTDSFSHQPAIRQPERQTLTSESAKRSEGLSRRLMLAGLASLPAVPAAAASTDAELIALGKEFEILVDAYYAACQPWSRALSAAHLECDVTSEASLANPDLFLAACDRNGVEQATERLDAITDELIPKANAILALPVKSIEGLRAKALVAFREVSPLGADDTDYCFDNEVAFQQLFVAVAEVCGLNGKIAATGFEMPPMYSYDDEEEEA